MHHQAIIQEHLTRMDTHVLHTSRINEKQKAEAGIPSAFHGMDLIRRQTNNKQNPIAYD